MVTKYKFMNVIFVLDFHSGPRMEKYPQSFNIPKKEKRMKWNFIDIGHEQWLEEEKKIGKFIP